MRLFTRLISLALLAGLLILGRTALAVPAQLIYQSDVAFGNETFLLTYDSVPDFVAANEASSVLTSNNFATGGYLAGFTYDGSQYHLIYQSDVAFGNETFVLSYDSLTDFVASNEASSVLTSNNFATGGYLAGFTWDGSQYHLIYQTDVAFGNETYVLSYDSLTDFIDSNEASTVLTSNNFATGGYLAGFTWDGSQYHLVYQSDVLFGNETFLLSYNSLTDFIDSNEASSVLTSNNFATGGYLAGFNAVPAADAIPEPSALLILCLGLAGLLLSMSQKFRRRGS